MMMTTIKTKRAGRLTAAILMLLAATAPVARPALAQAIDLQSASMAEGIDDEEAQASNAVVEPQFDRTPDAAEQPQAGDFYCGERKLGQWFYCERPKAKPSAPQASAQPQQSSTAQLKAITKQLDELKARAILEPTEANVIAYVRYQREQLDRASTFSDTWQSRPSASAHGLTTVPRRVTRCFRALASATACSTSLHSPVLRVRSSRRSCARLPKATASR
jgi:conjugal transfer pilus assembly protein TraF